MNAYRACIKEAAEGARLLAQRAIGRALQEMPVLATANQDIVERAQMGEAARVLAKHKDELARSFAQQLLANLTQAVAGQARATAVSFDSLELMGEDQVQENVDLVRAQQAIAGAVDGPLVALDALMSAAQGLPSVLPAANPLRPEVYARSLRDAVQQSPVPFNVRRRWTLHVAAGLGPELALEYEQLAARLRAQGVRAAAYATPQSAAAEAPTDASLLNVRELRRLLAEPAAPRATAAPVADEAMTVPAAFEALAEMRQVDQVMQRLRERQALGAQATGGGIREAFRAEARTTAQALGLEVVQLMVDNIASDTRLAAPVRDMVRRLEPALLRLALGDPRFFSDRKHPARELLDELTQRSLAWAAPEVPGFGHFMTPLSEAVEALLGIDTASAEPFAIALQTLRDAWDEAQDKGRKRRDKAVRVLLRAEQRHASAPGGAQADPVDTWLDPLERGETGFVETGFAHTRDERAIPDGGLGDMQLPDPNLVPGTWVEMQAAGGWERWQLSWSSPGGSLVLFTHPSGRTQSMASDELARRLSAGTARVFAAQTVVDGALDAVAQAAFRNSIHWQ